MATKRQRMTIVYEDVKKELLHYYAGNLSWCVAMRKIMRFFKNIKN